ncbi:MAG: molecular chaperone DnaK [Sandaracinaceae bacterium]|nr:molecular chaperone DnaK [Sandaracinaceae bacterium]
MSRIVGIDLGTTNCCVAVVDDAKPRVIPNKHGYNTTPSVVAVTETGQRIVGQIAVRQAVTNPEHTVQGAKRLMGRPFDSDEVRHAAAHASFEIVPGPHEDTRIILHGKEHSIPELSAMFLQEMRVVAEDYTGVRVDRAVVTVPAYFNDNQRQAVRDAGAIAGLEVVRILNEPTAAALAFGFGTSEPKTLAVYDLGGGTFDISIVRIDEHGEFHVVSTTGDSFLGGEDFDERVMDFLMKAFYRDNEIDLRESPIALQRVRQAAQKAKTELSSVDETDVSLPFIISTGPTGPRHMEYTVTRQHLEQLTGDLVTRTLQICEIGLQYAQLKPEEIDEVILVGGMTRMPAVQRAVEGYFERPPCKGVHPDEVVALGAALAAHAIEEDRDTGLHDVTAHSLGIMTAGGGFDALIPAMEPVPTKVEELFTTSRDGQTTVKIVVLQGESQWAAENNALGRFALTNLRPGAAGGVRVRVTFTIDEDGIFSVGAKDLDTGEEKTIDVLASSGLSDDEIERMMADSAEFLAFRRAEESREDSRQACSRLIAKLKGVLPEAEKKMAWTPVGANAVEKARKAVQLVETGLSGADDEALTKQHALLLRVEQMIDRALEKAS